MPDDLDTPSCPSPNNPASILEHFATLPDPRREQGRIHQPDEIIFMAICAVLCGADSWEEIADYARSKLDWLKTFLTLPGGGRRMTPSAASSVCSTRWPSRGVSSPG